MYFIPYIDHNILSEFIKASSYLLLQHHICTFKFQILLKLLKSTPVLPTELFKLSNHLH